MVLVKPLLFLFPIICKWPHNNNNTRYLQYFSSFHSALTYCPCTIEQEGQTLHELHMWLWLFTLLSVLLCPLHSPHHISLSLLLPSVSSSLSFFLLSFSTLNQHPLPPISSVRSLHYGHPTCGAHFISLHLRESKWAPRPPWSVMNALVNYTCTHSSAGCSQQYLEAV